MFHYRQHHLADFPLWAGLCEPGGLQAERETTKEALRTLGRIIFTNVKSVVTVEVPVDKKNSARITMGQHMHAPQYVNIPERLNLHTDAADEAGQKRATNKAPRLILDNQQVTPAVVKQPPPKDNSKGQKDNQKRKEMSKKLILDCPNATTTKCEGNRQHKPAHCSDGDSDGGGSKGDDIGSFSHDCGLGLAEYGHRTS
ncbi:hypothetical protein SELMODRAFT_429038 [Selaginella moellendorffii]|uniref:Uncharacterized protein n=1 Tax=Selaginella moellendorffii TaxID=88036 RepID=D8T4V2_SELML|nr:hypothetical protein SELMODRAFT_429038 [Selaginella moellendorffii]